MFNYSYAIIPEYICTFYFLEKRYTNFSLTAFYLHSGFFRALKIVCFIRFFSRECLTNVNLFDRFVTKPCTR